MGSEYTQHLNEVTREVPPEALEASKILLSQIDELRSAEKSKLGDFCIKIGEAIYKMMQDRHSAKQAALTEEKMPGHPNHHVEACGIGLTIKQRLKNTIAVSSTDDKLNAVTFQLGSELADKYIRPLEAQLKNTLHPDILDRALEAYLDAESFPTDIPTEYAMAIPALVTKIRSHYMLEPMLSLPAKSEAKPGFKLNDDALALLLKNGLKPEEIGGSAELQHDRIGELVRWFVRLAGNNANPTWAVRHAYELAYYVATQAGNRDIDLEAMRMKSFEEGVTLSDDQREMVQRILKSRDKRND